MIIPDWANAKTAFILYRLPVHRKFLRLKRAIMKQEKNESKVYLDQEELNTLVSEVKETVATGIKLEKESQQKNIFSAADLWNIQRMKASVRRRSTLWD